VLSAVIHIHQLVASAGGTKVDDATCTRFSVFDMWILYPLSSPVYGVRKYEILPTELLVTGRKLYTLLEYRKEL